MLCLKVMIHVVVIQGALLLIEEILIHHGFKLGLSALDQTNVEHVESQVHTPKLMPTCLGWRLKWSHDWNIVATFCATIYICICIF